MTPGEFIAKWRASELKERSASQEHFIDLCRLLGEPTPATKLGKSVSEMYQTPASSAQEIVAEYG